MAWLNFLKDASLVILLWTVTLALLLLIFG